MGSLLPQGVGKHIIVLNRALRDELRLKLGSAAEFTIQRDFDLRKVKVPARLEEALEGNAPAKKAFESLSNSHKREYVDWILAAKREDTRTKGTFKAIHLLSTGRGPKPQGTPEPLSSPLRQGNG